MNKLERKLSGTYGEVAAPMTGRAANKDGRAALETILLIITMVKKRLIGVELAKFFFPVCLTQICVLRTARILPESCNFIGARNVTIGRSPRVAERTPGHQEIQITNPELRRPYYVDIDPLYVYIDSRD